jgi:hypothetical protein
MVTMKEAGAGAGARRQLDPNNKLLRTWGGEQRQEVVDKTIVCRTFEKQHTWESPLSPPPSAASPTCESIGSTLQAVAEELNEGHCLAEIVRVLGREEQLLLHYVAQLQREKEKKVSE